MRPKMILFVLLLACGLAAAGIGVQVDPYYVNLLKAGKEAYRAGDCRKALQYLEVSIFGLHTQKKLAAEARIYMGLAHVSLKDATGGKADFDRAAELLAPEGFEALGLEEGVQAELDEALGSGRLVSPPKAGPGEGGKPESVVQNEALADIRLARIEFDRKKFKRAVELLNRGLGPTAGSPLDRTTRLKARILFTLSLFRLNRLQESSAYFGSVRDEYPADEIAAAVKDEGLESSWSLMAARFHGTR
jgi:hypothetical protein